MQIFYKLLLTIEEKGRLITHLLELFLSTAAHNPFYINLYFVKFTSNSLNLFIFLSPIIMILRFPTKYKLRMKVLTFESFICKLFPDSP